jgi:hypothetical protein
VNQKASRQRNNGYTSLVRGSSQEETHHSNKNATRVFSISDEHRLIFLSFTLPYMRYASVVR